MLSEALYDALRDNYRIKKWLRNGLLGRSGGRSLTTDIETINLDDDSITWHYSATKVSETQFNYGATSDSILPKDGIVTLSQGEWTIGLLGIKDGKKVYTGTTSNVTIKWNFYEPNVTVPITVKQNTGDYGYIVLTVVKIPVNEELKTPNFASIDSTIIMNFNGVSMRLECIHGPHTVTFEYRNDNGDVKSSMSIVVEVISGRETTISGNIDKSEVTSGSSSLTEVKQAIEVKKEGDTVLNVLVVPANTSSISNQTTVTFPQGSLPEEASTAVLNLSVKSADNNFSVTSTPLTGESATVAGIDISLLVNDQPVTSFNGQNVTINTFIATGLTGVKVYYNGSVVAEDSESNDIYNEGTGELTFTTTHFSEFYVGTNCEAVNVTTNEGYATLAEAINETSQTGDVITLIADAKMSDSLIIDGGKQITIDLNGFDISAPEKVIQIKHANVTLTGKGTVFETQNDRYGAVLLFGAGTDQGANYSVVNVGENVTLRGWSGIFVSKDESDSYNNYGVVANVKGKIILPGMDEHPTIDGAGIYINGQNNNTEGNVSEFNLDGAEITGETGIYAAGYAKWNLNNVKIDADSEALSIKAGKFVIDGGIYNAKGEFADPSEDTSNGSVEIGAALSMTSNKRYAHKIDVTVIDGIFESLNGYAVYEGIPNEKDTSDPVAPESYVTLNITGGKFVGNSERGAIKISKMTNKKVVTGGMFSDNPSSYLAKDYGVIKQDDKYLVAKIRESNGVYLIENAEELILFANLVNEC